jgi:hypothetical protein
VPPPYAPTAAWIGGGGAGGVATAGEEEFAGESGAADAGGGAVDVVGKAGAVSAVRAMGLRKAAYCWGQDCTG